MLLQGLVDMLATAAREGQDQCQDKEQDHRHDDQKIGQRDLNDPPVQEIRVTAQQLARGAHGVAPADALPFIGSLLCSIAADRFSA